MGSKEYGWVEGVWMGSKEYGWVLRSMDGWDVDK